MRGPSAPHCRRFGSGGVQILFEHYKNNLAFTYDHAAGGTLVSDGTPGLLIQLGGSDLFGTVSALSIEGPGFTDSALKHILAFKKLRRLFLRDTRVTQAGLSILDQLSSLELLIVAGRYYSQPVQFRKLADE
jgi:hypothetical protein